MFQGARYAFDAELLGVHLLDDAGDALFDDGNGFVPGLEGLGGVAGVEGARVRLLGGGSALGLCESALKVRQPSFEVCFAHRLRLTSRQALPHQAQQR